jgi:hypothetical protein
VDAKAIDSLIQQGFQRHILYCPSFAAFDDDQIWNFAMPTFRVLGMALTFKGISIVLVLTMLAIPCGTQDSQPSPQASYIRWLTNPS